MNASDMAIEQVGDPDGFPLVYHHGTPGSRLLPGPWHAAAAERGLRVLAFDRTGYAGRRARPGRAVADVVSDVRELADGLGLERFATFGSSGGGPHALATAAGLPGRVTAVATLAGAGPYGGEGLDFMGGMGEQNLVEFNAALAGREQLVPLLTGEAEQIRAAGPADVVGALASLLSEPDRAVLDETVAGEFLDELHEGLRGGIDGWIDDDLAFVEPWGFELSAVRVPVSVWQGDDDLMVPHAHAAWLASHVPGAELHMVPGEGHISLTYLAIGAVFDWLAANGRR